MSKTIQYYHNIDSIISEKTKQKRQQIKSLQDEFMTFSWGGYDAFENFGAFIINDKNGSLKFYNGPGFSNEYSKPQFDNSGGDLQGVNFNKQTISFTIGVYWINIKQYRLMLNWLNPLEVNYLIFGFNPDYRYNVKLSKLGDSTKWIVGKEDGEPMYYTEIPLTFEVQGTPCAKGVNSYEFVEWKTLDTTGESTSESTSEPTKIDRRTYIKSNDFIESDLPTPLDISLSFILQDTFKDKSTGESNNGSTGESNNGSTGESNNGSTGESESNKGKNYIYHVELNAELHDNRITDETPSDSYESLLLFSAEFQNLTIMPITTQNTETSSQSMLTESLSLNIRYNSEVGLLFLTYGDSNEKILSLLNLNDIGEKIINNYTVNKFSLPGRFAYPDFDTKKLQLKLSVWKYDSATNVQSAVSDAFLSKITVKQPYIVCYPRTNIL